MAKVICVLYDDPIDGYPKSYARDDIPKIERYPDGQIARPQSRSTSLPAFCWAVFPANLDCAFFWKAMAIRWW